jgi:hypothetical protein
MRDLKKLVLPSGTRILPTEIEAIPGMWIKYDMCCTIPSPFSETRMVVLVSTAHGWDHISVSHKNKIPSWMEMDYIKRIFFEDYEVAMQLHVTPKDHINIHNYVLHLWRPQHTEIPLPPKELV